jgi:hypothetical protein
LLAGAGACATASWGADAEQMTPTATVVLQIFHFLINASIKGANYRPAPMEIPR